jgi:uncharacterized protein YbjQ (UPF0145 family)
MDNQVMVSTINDMPGYDVVEVYGKILGLIVRSRNIFSSIAAYGTALRESLRRTS